MSEAAVDWPIYSCDDHLDLPAVPRDLWQRRLPAGLRDRGPRVVERDGAHVWVAGDLALGASGPLHAQYSAISRAGLADDGFRASDPTLRLADMDRDGIRASVIYGPSLFGLPIADAQVKDACWLAWNDWAQEFNAHAPRRLAVLPVLPTSSPEAAAREVERAARAGHRGALLFVHDIECGDPRWDRLWAAVQASDLPLSFHIGAGTRVKPRQSSWQVIAFSSVAPIQLDEPLAAMIFSGALERHPRMKLVLAESGIGWLPYFIARMDEAARKYKGHARDYQLRALPGEIFRRQVLATFEEEPLGAQLMPLLGADCFMWASDYPHTDSTFPHSRAAIARELRPLSPQDRRKVTSDNCRALYRFD